MSYPLSNLLVDPSHSKIWLNQLTSQELRNARLVSRNWNEFIISSNDLWKKFGLNERPPKYIPKFKWYNPMDWSILSEINLNNYNNYNSKLSYIYNETYYHFHREYINLPFLRKHLLLFFIAYLVLFLQTAAIIKEKYDCLSGEKFSYTRISFLFIWSAILCFHMLFYLFGIYIAQNYYENLVSSKISLPSFLYNSIPIGFRGYNHNEECKLNIADLGMLGLFVNLALFITLYSFTITDILLIGIWDLFFYLSQFEIDNLESPQKFDQYGFRSMLEGLSFAILVITAVQFNFALPIIFLILFYISYFLLYQHRYRDDANPPRIAIQVFSDLIDFQQNSSNELMFYCFLWILFFKIIHIYLFEIDPYSKNFNVLLTFITSLIICFYEASYLDVSLFDREYFNTYLGENYFNETYLGKYLSNLFRKLRVSFYQFFFLFYSCKLFYCLALTVNII